MQLISFTKTILTFLILLLMTSSVFTEIPQFINYQGYLYDSQGTPIDGNQLIKIVIYDADHGGTEIWNSEFRLVDVDNGRFNFQLGVSP